MRKRILLIGSMLLTLILIIVVIFNNINNKENNIISNINKEQPVINSNIITMMYETEAGSGEYTETTDNTWPESGYIFNSSLSGCENGGELEYNSINNTVNLLSNSSDQCYVYFDKYDGVWIDNVSITNVTGSSVTLDVSATSENGSITTYYYVINDSEEYQETTSNPITINDLNKLTEYKISIYAVDSTNAKSNIYEISATTTDISIPVINSVSVSNITTSGFTLTVDATSDVGISKYYFYINGDGEQIGGISTSNYFTFDTLNDGVSYSVSVFVEDINGIYSNKYTVYETTEKVFLLSDWIISQYGGTQGNNGIYYHTSNLANSAGDNSYRYSGANPNNYICFGSDTTACPSDNLYRIIGVFNSKVKIMKYDYPNVNQTGTLGDYRIKYGPSSVENLSSTYKGSTKQIGGYSWSLNSSSDWGSSVLNETNLNINFLNYINTLDNEKWSQLISTHEWKVGGYRSNSATPKTFFNEEKNGTTYYYKIGLISVSEYGFATSYTNWSEYLSNYDNNTIKNNNWMYMGMYEWTITPATVYYDDHTYLIGYGGDVYDRSTGEYNAIRPCFYLTSDVTYVSGSGTSYDPIRIQ